MAGFARRRRHRGARAELRTLRCHHHRPNASVVAVTSLSIMSSNLARQLLHHGRKATPSSRRPPLPSCPACSSAPSPDGAVRLPVAHVPTASHEEKCCSACGHQQKIYPSAPVRFNYAWHVHVFPMPGHATGGQPELPRRASYVPSGAWPPGPSPVTDATFRTATVIVAVLTATMLHRSG